MLTEVSGYIVISLALIESDFDGSQEKMVAIGRMAGSITTEECAKVEQALEATCLTVIGTTVCSWDVLLQPTSSYPVLS